MTTEERLPRLEGQHRWLKRTFAAVAVGFAALVAVAAAALEKPLSLDFQTWMADGKTVAEAKSGGLKIPGDLEVGGQVVIQGKDGKPAVEADADGLKANNLTVSGKALIQGKDVEQELKNLREEVKTLREKVATGTTKHKVFDPVLSVGIAGGVQVPADGTGITHVFKDQPCGKRVVKCWHTIVNSNGDNVKIFPRIQVDPDGGFVSLYVASDGKSKGNIQIRIHVDYEE